MYSITDMDGCTLDCNMSDDEIYNEYVKPKQYKLRSNNGDILYLQGKWLFNVIDFMQDQIDSINSNPEQFNILASVISNIDINLVDTIDTHYTSLEQSKYELLIHILSKTGTIRS